MTGIGRPDAASLTRLIEANLRAEARGSRERQTVVDARGTVRRTPRDADELVPGDAAAIAATALRVVAIAGQGEAAGHARVAADALRRLAAEQGELRRFADDLYARAATDRLGPMLLGDGAAMAAWLDSHPAERSRVEGMVTEAINLRLAWVEVHDWFVDALADLRRDWGVTDW